MGLVKARCDGDIDYVAMNFGTNTKYRADAEHPVAIYAASSWEIKSNPVLSVSSGDPDDLWLHFAKPGATFAIDSNAQVTGRIHAPESKVLVKSNSHVMGSVVAREIELDSNAGIHMDENLLAGAAGAGTAVRVSWRRLSPAEAEEVASPRVVALWVEGERQRHGVRELDSGATDRGGEG